MSEQTKRRGRPRKPNALVKQCGDDVFDQDAFDQLRQTVEGVGDDMLVKKNGVYYSTYPKIAQRLCLLGANMTDLATAFGVTHATLKLWRAQFIEFDSAIESAGDMADAKVAEAVYKRALGYDKVILKDGVPSTAHYPPDVKACIYWLERRRAHKLGDVSWSGKTEDDKADESKEFSEIEVARKLAFFLARASTQNAVEVPVIEAESTAQE